MLSKNFNASHLIKRFKRKIKVVIRNSLEYLNLYSHFPEIKSQFVFIVGCSNSGTTILTTLLGRNSKILALGDESYIFGQDKIYIKTALKQWDIFCRQFRKNIFVEKTPKHVFEIDRIFKYVPKAKILFIVRKPEDTIASLVTRGVDFNYAVKKYISMNKAGLGYIKSENVFLCRYENLVKNGEIELQRICNFIGVDYEEEMLSNNESVFHIWAQTGQSNKKKRTKEVTQKLSDKTGKGEKILSKEQLKIIKEKTNPILQML